MRLLVTTVIRHAKLGEHITGRVLEVDWLRGEVVCEFATPEPQHPMSNLNPRGGLRGGRGVRSWQGEYYVANYDTVGVYGPDWNLRKQLSHGLSTDIHEIDLDEEGIWISCSRTDLIIKLNFAGELIDHWHISDSPSLVQQLKVPRLPLDLSSDYRKKLPSGLDQTHLNSVQVLDNGSICLGLGRVVPDTLVSRAFRRLMPVRNPSMASPARKRLVSALRGSRTYVVKLDPRNREQPEIIASLPTLRPSHNGRQLSDSLVVLLHESGELRIWDRAKNALRSRIRIPASWVRGLVTVGTERAFVGTGPCGVTEVDLERGTIRRSLRLSDHPDESVHGLELIGVS